jgi:hypothetical protein
MSDKVFFNPGDTVQLKKEVSNKPLVMLVHSVDKMKRRDVEQDRLLGITCIWFTDLGELQKFRFDSKDLKHTK